MALSGHAAEQSAVTPEATIEAFVAALAENDFEKALNLCSAGREAAHGDWAEMVERLPFYDFNAEYIVMAPTEIPAFEALNREARRGAMAQGIYLFCCSFFSEDQIAQWQADNFSKLWEEPDGEGWPRAFAQRVDPVQLRELLVYKAVAFSWDTGQAEASFTHWMEVYGADAYEEWTVVYQLGDAYFGSAMILARYGECWYVFRLGATSATVENLVYRIPPEQEAEMWETLEEMESLGTEDR